MHFRSTMPESRSSLWMNMKIGLAGLGVVMGTTVFFVFRFVKTFERINLLQRDL